MKILLLGVGMQGKATLYDLVHNASGSEIMVADKDFAALQNYLAQQNLSSRVSAAPLDASDPASLDKLMSWKPDVVIDLLPTPFHETVAATAVTHNAHVVNASYATPGMQDLGTQAEARGVAILPEFGLDPGIDLVLLGEAARQFDRIDTVLSYGAGVPEAAAANNPIHYKVSWTFAGVLRSYRRPGWLVQEGKIIEIADTAMFHPEYVHLVDIEGLGRLEAYPNGDAVHFVAQLGLDPGELQAAGRYSMRWPGHADFWGKLVDLGLLDEEPVSVDGINISPRRFLAAVLEPRLQYGPKERDVVVVRVDMQGEVQDQRRRHVYEVVDYRDLDTGFMAMSRTVGFTASIGAQMLLHEQITSRGLLSPITDVPYQPFAQALAQRNIHIRHWEEESS